jgi:hypothetical protein
MEVKQAVAIAKNYVGEIFAGESLTNVGLEEVEFDEMRGAWEITVGFSRPWDAKLPWVSPALQADKSRSYKVVRISDSDGRVLSIKNREVHA